MVGDYSYEARGFGIGFISASPGWRGEPRGRVRRAMRVASEHGMKDGMNNYNKGWVARQVMEEEATFYGSSRENMLAT